MNGKTKSILLQVAFKEATSRGESVADVKLLTAQYYTMLLDLHSEIGIDPEDGAAPRRGGGGGFNRAPREKAAPPKSARTFTTSDGTQFTDYRVSKAKGEVKPNFPDFKSADNKQSIWAFDRDGAPNAEAADLIAAADAMASLTDPM